MAIWLNGRACDAAVADRALSARAPSTPRLVETFRIAAGRVPLWPLHAARLERAQTELGWDRRVLAIDGIVAELCARDGRRDGVGRLVVGPSLVCVETRPLPPSLGDERTRGIALQPSAHRRDRPRHKTDDPALRAAEAQAGGELLLIGSGGRWLETSRANLFCVTEGELLTPPDDGSILPGVARGLAIELARDAGLRVRETSLPIAPEPARPEIFVTNAVRGVRPVRRIGSRELAPCDEASIARRLQVALDKCIAPSRS